MLKNLKKELPILIVSVLMLIGCITTVVVLCNSSKPSVAPYLQEKYGEEFVVIEEISDDYSAEEGEEIQHVFMVSPKKNSEITFTAGTKMVDEKEEFFDTYIESASQYILNQLGGNEYVIENKDTTIKLTKYVSEKLDEVSAKLEEMGIDTEKHPATITMSFVKGDNTIEITFTDSKIGDNAIFSKIMTNIYMKNANS